MSDLSIIIVTYNSGQFIGGCLDSISGQTSKEFEVIIVDNNSTDKTLEIIMQKLPDARLISNKENVGFSRAVNQGIECSGGEFILMLNSDVVLHEDFIRQLKNALLRLPYNVGMISPKLLKMDKQRIDSTGLVLSKARRFYDRGQGSIDLGQFDSQQGIFGPCAAAAIYSKRLLEDIQIGNEYFDEDFFMILEDFDIAWRAKRYGWKAMFFPQLVCYHHGGISRKKSALCQYYTFRNRYLLLIKNAGVYELLMLLVLVPIYEIPRLLFLLLFNSYAMRSLKEIKRLSPRMWKKRKVIHDKSSVKDRTVFDNLRVAKD